jgi:serine/threonine protein phosphatase PrpC
VIREGRVQKEHTSLDTKPLIHADDKITMERAYTFNFKEIKRTLVPSSSLGHNELTGYNPEYKILTFDLDSDKVKIVCASDGFWDMVNIELQDDKNNLLTMDANSLCDFAERRWKQPWKYCTDRTNMDKFIVTNFPSYDDIGVATYEYVGSNVK